MLMLRVGLMRSCRPPSRVNAAVLFLALSFSLSVVAAAAQGDYIGSKSCNECHEAIWVGWQGTKHARAFMERGFQYIRCQLGGYQGITGPTYKKPEGVLPGACFNPQEKLTQIPELFAHVRKELGEEVELLHDIHERLAPINAVWLAKALEEYRLFFLEDLLAPEETRICPHFPREFSASRRAQRWPVLSHPAHSI